ncbi:MAG: anthranilate phosphoribosyltransferase [Candidatus Altiarchaeales archaeon]|nr:anthranilate phosphoribosyltransferase [Candidatus Altiarchaeales archaeon]MBD3415938.1 anthranilate phosphoribosyltransferase [Candidatus Altiarchaeales archaeon]
MKELISKLRDKRDLTADEAGSAMKKMMCGDASEDEMREFLLALKEKGESPVEIASLAKVMREYSTKVSPEVGGTLVDMCGTGGDGSHTFNISTAAMFVVAGDGVPVAKHGNRSITSKSGSADVLEALGANIQLPPERIKSSIEEVGVGFMFAPAHHPAMKHVMPVRKKLGVRTVFNILGPLTNPANADAQLMGVFDPELTETLAEVFKILGLKRALVVHGEPGLDELSTFGKSRVSELKDRKVRTYEVDPSEYGFSGSQLSVGCTAEENARLIRGILEGKVEGGDRDIVLLNAAGGLMVAGVADDLKEGLKMASSTVDSGRASNKLVEFIEYTNR